MKLKSTLVFLFLFGMNASAEVPPERFFARADFQAQAPGAFVLQSEAAAYLSALESTTRDDARRLELMLMRDPALYNSLRRFPTLERPARQAALERVFAIETALFAVRPVLIIDDRYPRAAFFKFNVDDPSDPGTVILNLNDPYMIKTPFAALSLLIHETRHAYQFARARGNAVRPIDRRVNRAFKAAFTAQEKLKGFTFLDFMTLTNEYEAFQFANAVIGLLTSYTVDDSSMGSLASQIDSRGRAKLNLPALHRKWRAEPRRLYDEFNALESAQRDRR